MAARHSPKYTIRHEDGGAGDMICLDFRVSLEEIITFINEPSHLTLAEQHAPRGPKTVAASLVSAAHRDFAHWDLAQGDLAA